VADNEVRVPHRRFPKRTGPREALRCSLPPDNFAIMSNGPEALPPVRNFVWSTPYYPPQGGLLDAALAAVRNARQDARRMYITSSRR
jgi:hypothetical protein